MMRSFDARSRRASPDRCSCARVCRLRATRLRARGAHGRKRAESRVGRARERPTRAARGRHGAQQQGEGAHRRRRPRDAAARRRQRGQARRERDARASTISRRSRTRKAASSAPRSTWCAARSASRPGCSASRTRSATCNVKVNAVTAGIRGTDVWGKSEGERDIVCLLEGRITVSHGAAQFTMQEPLSFYIAPRTGQAQPPSRVTPQQVKEWSAETEIDRAQRRGAPRRHARGDRRRPRPTSARANALRDKLRDSGFPADSSRARAGRPLRRSHRIARRHASKRARSPSACARKLGLRVAQAAALSRQQLRR